jgi:hypothetical protein
MKRFALLLLPLLIAGVVFGAADRRAEKLAMEREARSADFAAKVQAATGGWLLMYPEASGHDFRGVSLSPSGKIWITGFNTTTTLDWVWTSNDKGATWSKTQVLTGQGITEVAAVNDTEAVFGTFDGRIFYTKNGGVKWDSVYQYGVAGAGWFDGVRQVKGDTLIAFGDADPSGLLVVKSVDRGKTWTRFTNLPTEVQEADGYASYSTYRQAMSVYNRTVWISLYFGSSRNARLLKTTDMGATWTTWEVTLTGGTAQNYYFRAINFVDDSLGFGVDRQIATSNDHWVHKTTNGGLTWSDTLSLEPGPHAQFKVRSVKPVAGTTTWYAAGWNATGNVSRLWSSGDNGTTWTPMHPGTVGILTNTAFKTATEGYVVGAGIALKYSTNNVRKVTFNLNTATVPDTLPVVGSLTQVRGGVSNATGFAPITWGNDTQNNMSRVGGDYWKKDLFLQVGDTLNYKYVIQHPAGNTGWENGVVPANFPTKTNQNRSYVVADKDTVLPVEFWNNGASDRLQYFRPYAAVADSYMTVYFRVNMLGPISSGTFGFNNDKDTVGVRGSGPAGSDLKWSPTFFLNREAAAPSWPNTTVPPTSFWSGGLKFPKSAVNSGDSIFYKFLIGYDWGRDELGGGAPNRKFYVPVGKKDTTLYFSYFNNERPTTRANPDTVALTFRVNLAQAAASGGFNVTNDTIQVRSGYFNTGADPSRSKQMVRLSGTIFQFADTLVTAKGKNLDYQYYVVRSGVDTRENYYNFTYNGPTPSEAERRQFLIPTTASKSVMTFINDTSTSVTQARRQPNFKNSRVLAKRVRVRYEVNMKPAFYTLAFGDSLFDVQSAFRTIIPKDKDSLQKWGVWINGTALGAWENPTGDPWGVGLRDNLQKKMYDNGANGDRVANDTIWTRDVICAPESVSVGDKGRVGQVFKFGVYGGDNEGGRGGFGNNHVSNIVDADTLWTMADQFGSINPAYYRFWDYDNKIPKLPTAVGDAPVPLTFDLSQNYPNPFNPATQITYSLPVASKVELKVFNVLGQVVATLVDEVKPAGAYTARFDATNFATGMYIYKFQAGSFSSVKKMLLVK